MKQQAIERMARHARDTAAARRAVEGALIGARIMGIDALHAAAEAAAMAVRAAARTGGDVASVARSAVEGALDAAKELNLDAGAAAAAAAGGALRTAAEEGADAMEQVRIALNGVIHTA